MFDCFRFLVSQGMLLTIHVRVDRNSLFLNLRATLIKSKNKEISDPPTRGRSE